MSVLVSFVCMVRSLLYVCLCAEALDDTDEVPCVCLCLRLFSMSF